MNTDILLAVTLLILLALTLLHRKNKAKTIVIAVFAVLIAELAFFSLKG